MSDKCDVFLQWAREHGWAIVDNKRGEVQLNEEFLARYKEIPADYLQLLTIVSECVAPDEQTWFLCESDYNGSSDAEFRWDEFERLSLEAAAGDEAWASEIIAWWDRHLPIVLSVDGEYSFYAVELATGAIVHGAEPEFEEVDVVAPHLEAFYDYLMEHNN
ncbi:SMI1/KNR4 family protein [Paenibacillus sp. 598K]|uniref:SMI1/KNR4 family protein n=1 Tax=Paenibacillus sp. 598K TaxID=1117987 RepID=UPI000FFF5703|nr:SMI1/KNR4 family protein [Paenibacillus sp. 598K]